MALRRQLVKAANAFDHDRHEQWVARLLTLLSDKSLRDAAAKCTGDPREVIFDCNFVAEVWDDSRIKRRIDHLKTQEITVARRDHQTEVAGNTYTREQIAISF